MAEATETKETKETKSTTTQEPPAGSPEARIKELEKQNADLLKDTLSKKEQIKTLETQKANEEAEALKAQNKYKELYEAELPKSKRAQELEPVLNTILETEIAAIPEDKRDVIPNFEKPEQKLQWIQQAKTKGLFGTTTTTTKTPPPTTVQSKVNTEGTLPEFVSWPANDARLSSLSIADFQIWKKHNHKASTAVTGWGKR